MELCLQSTTSLHHLPPTLMIRWAETHGGWMNILVESESRIIPFSRYPAVSHLAMHTHPHRRVV